MTGKVKRTSQGEIGANPKESEGGDASRIRTNQPLT
jgi:hypothetical protein